MRFNSLLTLTALAVVSVAGVAHADMDGRKSTVRDSAGQIVTAISNGSCVRYGNELGADSCVGGDAAKAERTMLSDAERVIYFEFNKANLTAEAKRTLDGVVARLKAAKDVKSASIVGYADRIGAADYNVALSQKRANAVKAYLVKNGYLDVSVAETRALGASNSVTECSNSLPRAEKINCLAPDRRVNLELVYVE